MSVADECPTRWTRKVTRSMCFFFQVNNTDRHWIFCFFCGQVCRKKDYSGATARSNSSTSWWRRSKDAAPPTWTGCSTRAPTRSTRWPPSSRTCWPTCPNRCWSKPSTRSTATSPVRSPKFHFFPPLTYCCVFRLPGSRCERRRGQVGWPHVVVVDVVAEVKQWERQIRGLQMLVLLLPDENADLLRHLLCLLHRVTLNADANKMNALNLGTMMAPHILCPRKVRTVSSGFDRNWTGFLNPVLSVTFLKLKLLLLCFQPLVFLDFNGARSWHYSWLSNSFFLDFFWFSTARFSWFQRCKIFVPFQNSFFLIFLVFSFVFLNLLVFSQFYRIALASV